MPYYNWTSIEEIYAGTTVKFDDRPEMNNMALHTSDKPEQVITNRKAFMQELNFPLEQCVFANQTHSNNIHKVTKEDIGAGAFSTKDAIQNCDALYTRDKNILLGVFCADCVPILIYDREQKIIAAVHAGWQGTVNELTKKMIDLLIYEEDCDPKELYAYIGPAIDLFNFEVGEDVAKKVRTMSFNTEKFIVPKEDGTYLVDNKHLNYQMMLNAGIPSLNIFVSDKDTYEEENEFFSFRKHKDTGRNMTFILQT